MLDRLSIRAKLTAAFAGAMVVVLVLAGLFVYLRVKSDLNNALDEGLRARADDVGALLSTAGGESGTIRLEAQRAVERDEGFAIVLRSSGGPASTVTPDDRKVVASTLRPGTGPVLTAEEAEEAALKPIFVSDREVPGIEGEARILARPVTAGDRVSVVVVGASTEEREEALAGLLGAFAIGGPIALLLASGLGYVLAGRALAPVEAMRRRAAEITLERSGERLPLPRADDEIHQLGATLNAMLDRIEASLERERAFVADAGHELRTPLAILRAELELAEREGRSVEELRRAITSAAEETDRLSQLAEDLLVIARSDQGKLPIKRERIELRALLGRVRGRFARRAVEAGREIAIAAPDGVTANLDPLRVEQALGNLVDNALRYGEGEIRIDAIRSADSVRLEVTDQGPGLRDDFAERAFERFTRADEVRTGGGAGLGLAIVRAIARAHGGDAEVNGAGVAITLPS
jgi:two-component system, OmpR family, sensor kinase